MASPAARQKRQANSAQPVFVRFPAGESARLIPPNPPARLFSWHCFDKRRTNRKTLGRSISRKGDEKGNPSG
jgi:hypothetical protein